MASLVYSILRRLRVLSEVAKRLLKQCEVVLEAPKARIAAVTEKAANRARLMVMVDAEWNAGAVAVRASFRAATYRACAPLPLKKALIVIERKSKLALEPRSSHVLLRLPGICRAPFRNRHLAAFIAFGLEAVRAAAARIERRSRFPFLAGAAQLFTAPGAIDAPRVESRELEGLALDLPAFGPRHCRDRSSLSASALTEATRYVSHRRFLHRYSISHFGALEGAN